MWFRRDLRLDDHEALAAVAAEGSPVIPLFVVDPAFTRAGGPRQAFLRRRLAALDAELGGTLVYRHGDPVDAVGWLMAEVGASTVFVTRDHTPYGRRRDAAVAAALGGRLVEVGSNYAVAPGSVTKGDGSPYSVFTPFSRGWRAHGWQPPVEVPAVDWYGAPSVPCDGPPPEPASAPPDDSLLAFADRIITDRRWEHFRAEQLAGYPELRNTPGVDGTSRLSAALRWGVIHPRTLLTAIDHSGSDAVFANELAWREFYADVLLRRPDSAWHNIDRRMDALPTDTDTAARARFDRWAAGRTGFPIVDAGMRQLAATGWMHNRVRMITASFLTKDLHLPWQWGARWFMRHLVDGDLASNSHGWQWTAGTGTDAAPFFRVFNPTAQGERVDPDGAYVHTWVPELRGVPGAMVHDPGLLRPDDYPQPMVDHAAERLDALARYQFTKAAGAPPR
jgi:deoxyribodipyrimidine photo-lyase